MSFSATYRPPEGEEIHVGAPHDGEAGRRCALGFNPSGDFATDKIKGFHAAAMQSVIDQRDQLAQPDVDASTAEKAGYHDAMRCFATALTHLEAAQMFAVKGRHAPKNAQG